ncbi:hypothetical protein BDQ17DRAFT_1412100 [Cyathus striatus]|nr:hypothetical protein BDQ17DRAFT_1412100 [Cyathus striatus]
MDFVRPISQTIQPPYSKLNVPQDIKQPQVPDTVLQPILATRDNDHSSRKNTTEKFKLLPSILPPNHTNNVDLYIFDLYESNRGCPLWNPGPPRKAEYFRNGVTVGDVGYITPHGSFFFLFNIWTDRPVAYSVASPPGREVSSVELQRSMVSNVSNSDYDNDKGNMKINYTLLGEERGSFLCMPHGGTSEDYKNKSNLKDFIAMNAEAWYRYALESRCAIGRHSLYLVTGHMKSKSWGIATTLGSSEPGCHSLILEESSDPEQPGYTWNNRVPTLSSRTGPGPLTDIPNSANQCPFLHGFKISLSENAWNEINVPSLEQHGKPATPFHPLNEVNEQILTQNSRARIAISHDKHCSSVYGDSKDKDGYPLTCIKFHEDTNAYTLELLSDILGPNIKLFSKTTHYQDATHTPRRPAYTPRPSACTAPSHDPANATAADTVEPSVQPESSTAHTDTAKPSILTSQFTNSDLSGIEVENAINHGIVVNLTPMVSMDEAKLLSLLLGTSIDRAGHNHFESKQFDRVTSTSGYKLPKADNVAITFNSYKDKARPSSG